MANIFSNIVGDVENGIKGIGNFANYAKNSIGTAFSPDYTNRVSSGNVTNYATPYLQGKINASPTGQIQPIPPANTALSNSINGKSPNGPSSGSPSSGSPSSNGILGNIGFGNTTQNPGPAMNGSSQSAPRPTDYTGSGLNPATNGNTPINPVYTGATQNLGSQTQGNQTSNTAASGLLGIAQNGSPQVQNAIKNIQGLQNTQNEIATNPNVANTVAAGRGQAITGEINAAQTGLQNQLAQQAQQITAGNEAGGLGIQGQQNQISAQQNAGNLTQPVANAAFFGSPEAGGTYGGGSNLIGNGVQTAANLIANGATTQDAIAQAGLSNLGPGAMQALTQQMQKFDPNWTPTSSNAIAQQNIKQGQGYQQQATDLNTNLTQMKNVTQPILSLIQGAGLNQQDSPFFNSSINEYSKQFLNPSAQASLNAGVAELKTYVSNILGTGGDLTPTAVTQLVNSFDPGNFTGAQLSSFLDNLNNYGQQRLQGFQQSAQGSYGGHQGYTGAQATPSSNATIAPNNPKASVTIDNPVGQGIAGGAMQALGGIEGLITGIASKVLQ